MEMEDAAKTLDAVVTKRRNELAGLARRSRRPDKVVWQQVGWRAAVMTNYAGRFVGCYAVKDF